MQSITFLDETATGQVLHSWDVSVENETMTLQELIMLRVKEEILRRTEASAAMYFNIYQELTEAEQKLNLQKHKANREAPDPEAYGYRALDAFKRNAFFVLIGNKQVDDLQEVIDLRRENPISFVRLTPLVGG
jgi:hypothetical protein